MDDIVFVETNATGHGVRALRQCSRLGLRSVFLTCQPGYYGADVLSMVDRWEEVDTADPQAMLSRVRVGNTLGVLTFLDYPMLATIELARRVGVPHPDRAAIERCRSKDLTRDAIGEGVDQPAYRVLGKDALPDASPIGYPCVLKPVDDSGSLGVTICFDRDDFRAAISSERHRSNTARGFALSPRVLVEEYVDGPEFSAELIYAGERWHLLGITRKLMSSPPFAVCVGHVFPARLDESTHRSIRECVIRWVTRVGLAFGAAHVEFRLGPRGPVLIEINPRLGGALITELIRHASGFDAVDYIMRQACGLPVPGLMQGADGGAAALLYLCRDARGQIAEVRGADAIEEMSGVVEVSLPRVGDPVRPLMTDYDRLGHVMARGRDEDEALKIARDALGAISLEVRASR